MEFGYQRPNISDKKIDRWYFVFNPAVDKSFRGPGSSAGLEFAPNAKFSYDVTRRVAAGVEYYGGYGPIGGFDPLREQQQQIMPALDMNFGDKWEFNFGVGLGVTQVTDRLLIKAILGYRFNFHTN